MDYSKKLYNFLKTVNGIDYTDLPVNKWIAKLPLLPVYLLRLVCIIQYFIYSYIYGFIFTFVKSLEDWQKSKLQNVRHATEAIISLLTIPVLLVLQIVLGVLLFNLCINWFFIMSFTYVITFGKVKWQPFLYNTDDDFIKQTVYYKTPTLIKVYMILLFALCIAIVLTYLNYTFQIIYCYNFVYKHYVLFNVETIIYYVMVLINPFVCSHTVTEE